jgi:hypothetical protein
MDRVVAVIAAFVALLIAACGGGEKRDGPRDPIRSLSSETVIREPVKVTATPTITYAANCGGTSYLAYKADHWSAGCMAGSLNVNSIAWPRWSIRSARGQGRVELRDPYCRPTCPEAKIFRYPGRIALSRPRTCRDDAGTTRRYFSRVTVRVRWPAGNPFDEPVGWGAEQVQIRQSGCALAP